MAYLPLAHILHHKLRSLLSALGIGIAVCMLVTLAGLSRGSLMEIADRWESVDADVIVFPRGAGDSAGLQSGSLLNDRYADLLRDRAGDVVQHAVPVFLWQVKLGGQDQLTAGVAPKDWPMLVGHRKLTEGRLFDPDRKFARWLEGHLLAPAKKGDDSGPFDPTAADLSAPDHNGLEMVIDSRLARAGKLHVGQKVKAAGNAWTIVGIVPAGGMTRVYVPRRTAQFLFGDGNIRRSTLMFVKFRPGVDLSAARKRVREITHQDAVPVARYRGMLLAKFAMLYVYVDAVNAVALVIAFLFIMNTLYTMTLERRRDIAILKSCGAGWWFILRQVLAESCLLTFLGYALGAALTIPATWAVGRFAPLLTVKLSWTWYTIAAGAAVAGAAVSAIYPAYRAARVDPAETLTLE